MRAAAAVVVALAIVASAGAAGGAQLAQPTWAPDGAHIAWAADSAVWVSAADGSGARRLRAFDGIGQITWETGSAILVDSNFTIFRMSLGGAVAKVGSAFDMTFSADAARRHLATGSPGCPFCHGPVQVLDLRTRRVAKVGNPAEANSNPGLSPDGRHVAYARATCVPKGECNVDRGIWISPTSGGGRARLLAPSGGCPVWAPDGRRIAVLDPLHGGLRVYPAAGGAATTVEPRVPCGTSYPPVFSPDSTRLAFVDRRERLAVWDLRSRRVLRRTPSSVGRVVGLAWEPDGSALVLAARPGDVGCSSLWRLEVGTGSLTPFRRCE